MTGAAARRSTRPGCRLGGNVVHDRWKVYTSYEDAIHALRGGNDLRELLGGEGAVQASTLRMSCLLVDITSLVDEAKAGADRAHRAGAG